MKKLLLSIFVVLVVFCCFFINSDVQAIEEKNILETETTGKLIELKEKTGQELKDYEERYGSQAYGLAAFILNKVRIYSIPFCFIGIAVGSIFQYVIGIRKLDVRDKGFALIITFVTILVICQILPLIFALVVFGWRG